MNIWGFLCVISGPLKGHYYHRHFLRGDRAICHMMKRVSNKSAQRENASSCVWGWPSPSPSPTVATLVDGASSGTVSAKRCAPPLDAAMVVAFDDDDRQPQPPYVILVPAPTIQRPKDKAIREFLDPAPFKGQWWSHPPCLEGSITREQRGTTFLSLPPHMDDKSSAAAICSIEEPMDDWLSCLEKLFEDAPCPHPKEWTHCDSSDARSKHCYHHNYSAKSGSSWDVLEPRPLRMNTKGDVWKSQNRPHQP